MGPKVSFLSFITNPCIGFAFSFSELHREKLCEKKLVVLVSRKGPQLLGLRDRIF